jgi:hypothetical protein
MSQFLLEVIKYRKDNQEECHEKIKILLHGSYKTAF